MAATLRRLAVPIYVPWLGISLGFGILQFVLPVGLSRAGYEPDTIGWISACLGVGAALSTIPLGVAIARVGEWSVMVASLAAACVAFVVLGVVSHPWVMGAGLFVIGVGGAGVLRGAQTFVALGIPSGLRGRSLSMMGGIRRLGMAVGPSVGGVLIALVGFRQPYLACAALSLVGLLALVGSRRVLVGASQLGRGGSVEHRPSALAAIGRHGRRLLTVASGPVLISLVRSGRHLLFPLVAVSLGHSTIHAGLVVTSGTAADLALFPVAGYLMDTFGRLKAIVPAFALMGTGVILLGFVDGTLGVVIAGLVAGVGNGLSSGTMLTLGSDLAPDDAPSEFMAAFAALQSWGSVLGPLLVGLVAAWLSLQASAIVLGVALYIGVALVVLTAGETLAKQP